jgi:hypothetical protein
LGGFKDLFFFKDKNYFSLKCYLIKDSLDFLPSINKEEVIAKIIESRGTNLAQKKREDPTKKNVG